MPQKRTIQTIYEAKVDKFTANTRKASGELDKFEKKSVKSANAIKSAFKTLAAPLSIGAGVIALDKLSEAVQRSTSNLDNLGKASRRLGLTTDQLQEIRILAEAAGIQTQTLDTAFQRFARRVGSGTLDKTFKELDISIQDINGNLKTNFQLWDEFGRKVSALDDENRQLALAMNAVDTEGVKLVELWRMSGEQVDKVKDRIKEYGLIFDKNLIAKAEKYQTALGLIKRAQDSLDTLTTAGLTSWSLEWERLKLKIDQAKFSLLDFFGVFGPGGQTAEERGLSLLTQQKQLEEQRLTLTKRYLDAETDAERSQIEDRMRINRRFREENIKEREKVLAILEGRQDKIITGDDETPGTGLKGQDKEREKARSAVLRSAKAAADRIKKEREESIKLATAEEKILANVRKEWIGIIDPLKEIQEKIEAVRLAFDPDDPIGVEALFLLEQAQDDLINKEDDLIDKTDDLSSTWNELGGTFASAFEDAIVSGSKFSDILKGLEQDIIRIFTRKLLTEPLTNAFSSLAGNVFGNLFNQGAPVETRATGGPVSVGRPYLVGESGPELFMPNQSGSIVPSKEKSSSSINVVINEAPPGTEANVQSMPDGSEMIDIIIGQVDSRIATGGSTHQAISQSFGLRQAGLAR